MKDDIPPWLALLLVALAFLVAFEMDYRYQSQKREHYYPAYLK